MAHARVVAEGTQGSLTISSWRPTRSWSRWPVAWIRPSCAGRSPSCAGSPTPTGADRQAERRHERRGVWLSPTWAGMVAVDGLLDPEAGHILQAALEPLARPAAAPDPRQGGQRTADALTELARRALEGGRLPTAGGVRPQLLVTVDLDSLLGRPAAVGGRPGGRGGCWPPRDAGGWPATRR